MIDSFLPVVARAHRVHTLSTVSFCRHVEPCSQISRVKSHDNLPRFNLIRLPPTTCTHLFQTLFPQVPPTKKKTEGLASETILDMAFAGITLVCGIIHFMLSILILGMSATCIADGNEVIFVLSSRLVNVISNIPVVPRCIRCGYMQTTPIVDIIYVTDPDEVIYLRGGQQIMNGSIDGVIIFNDGLLVEDPAGSFSNGNSIQCQFTDGFSTMTHTITFIISAFLPPPITPNGTAVLDYVEGDNVNLTCTGNDVLEDEYQWTLPDGSTIPSLAPIVADNGLDIELKNVNRTDSGVYNCTGTVSGESLSVVSSVTLNIQYPARVLSLVGNSANLSIGSLLTLNCSFEGNPNPTISWSHNGNIIPSDNITDNYALLEITLDSSQSLGEYTCTVNNTISNTAVSDSMTYSVPELDSSTSTRIYTITITSTTSTTVSVHDETTAITTSAINVCDETCVTTVYSTPSSKPSLSTSGQPTIIISELQNGSLPSYGVILVVLLSIISVLSITINIIIILVVWYWKRTKTTSKSSTSTTTALGNDVDDNSAYGMRDTQLIREP